MQDQTKFSEILNHVDNHQAFFLRRSLFGGNSGGEALPLLSPSVISNQLANTEGAKQIIHAGTLDEAWRLLTKSYLISDVTVIFTNNFLCDSTIGHSGPLGSIQSSQYLSGAADYLKFLSRLAPLVQNDDVFILPSGTEVVYNVQHSDDTKDEDSDRRSIQHEYVLTATANNATYFSATENQLTTIDQASRKSRLGSDYTEFFFMELPYLENLDLLLLMELKRDYSLELQSFRVGIKDAIRELRAISRDERNVRKRALEIKRDVIDLEIEKLNRKYRQILRYRSIRILASAVLSATPVAMHYLGIPLDQAIKNLVGVGSIGATLNEMNELRRDVNDLRNNPMYFLWKMNRY